MHNFPFRLFLFLSTWLFSAFVNAVEIRHHGTHQHGSGQLDVGLENNHLNIILSLPAMNVVGFEHKPTTITQNQSIEQAINYLKDGLSLFQPNPESDCQLTEVSLNSGLIESNEHHHHESEHSEHADFVIDYLFTCQYPVRLTHLKLSVFDKFPRTETLQTRLISPNVQTRTILDAEHPTLELQ